MKLHRLKRTVAILACVFVLGGIAAIGAGADVAVDAADVVLVKSRLGDVPAARPPRPLFGCRSSPATSALWTRPMVPTMYGPE